MATRPRTLSPDGEACPGAATPQIGSVPSATRPPSGKGNHGGQCSGADAGRQPPEARPPSLAASRTLRGAHLALTASAQPRLPAPGARCVHACRAPDGATSERGTPARFCSVYLLTPCLSFHTNCGGFQELVGMNWKENHVANDHSC